MEGVMQNLTEDQVVEYEHRNTATSGSATSDTETITLVWGNLPPTYGIKLKWVNIQQHLGYTFSRGVLMFAEVSCDPDSYGQDVPRPPGRLGSSIIYFTPIAATGVEAVNLQLGTKRIDYGLGVRLPTGKIVMVIRTQWLDTVAAAPVGYTTISVGYQFFKFDENEYAQLVASSVY
jgi:hypothetical protein